MHGVKFFLNLNIIRIFSFFLFFGSISFLRGKSFFEISSVYFLVISLFIFFFSNLNLLRINHAKEISARFFLLWIFGALYSVSFSFIFGNLHESEFLSYLYELVLIVLLFLAGILFVLWTKSIKAIGPYLIIWFIYALFLQFSDASLSSVRRLTGELSSRNYSGLVVGITCVFCCYIISFNRGAAFIRKMIYLLLFVASFLSLVLIGTRSILLPVIAIIIVTLFNRRSFIFICFPLVLLMPAQLFFSETDFSPMLSRFFSAESLLGISSRADLIIDALSDMDVYSLFLGFPSAYTIFDQSDYFYHPHNFFLSNLIFLGFFPFIFSIFLILSHFYVLKSLCNYPEIILLRYFYLLCLFYVFVSGEFTRGWIFFFLIGVVCGVNILNRRGSVSF